MDGDKVEESNLKSQNYRMEDIGKPKSEALKEYLLRINPEAHITLVNKYIDEDNVEALVKDHDAAINSLVFRSDIPFVFDGWCQKYNIPVIHPYNLGWGGLAFVVTPAGPQLKDFYDKWENFEINFIEHVINYFKIWGQPKPWIEHIVTRYKDEKDTLPPPQLPVASWIAAGLCVNLLFCIATGQRTKIYPKFYLSSIIGDMN